MQRKSLKWLKADFIYWWHMKRDKNANIAMIFVLVYLILALFIYTPLKMHQYQESKEPKYAKVLNQEKSCSYIKHREYCKSIVTVNYKEKYHYLVYYENSPNYLTLRIGKTYDFNRPFSFFPMAELTTGSITENLFLDIMDTVLTFVLAIMTLFLIIGSMTLFKNEEETKK